MPAHEHPDHPYQLAWNGMTDAQRLEVDTPIDQGDLMPAPDLNRRSRSEAQCYLAPDVDRSASRSGMPPGRGRLG